MAKYVLMGKYSTQFSEGMVHTPQDRMKIVVPMLESLDIELKEFFFLPSNPDNDFVAIVEVDPSKEKKLYAGGYMVHATGTFEKINAYRAYDNDEMTEIFQIGSDGVSNYVSAKKVAGLE